MILNMFRYKKRMPPQVGGIRLRNIFTIQNGIGRIHISDNSAVSGKAVSSEYVGIILIYF